MRTIFRAFVLGSALWVSGCANAPEALDPTEARVIGPGVATSKCIGDISTPLCALDTWHACLMRPESAYCDKAGTSESALKGRPATLRYRILLMEIVGDEVLSGPYRKPWMKPGDATIMIQYVNWRDPACHPEGCRADFYFGRTSSGWRLTNWNEEGGPD